MFVEFPVCHEHNPLMMPLYLLCVTKVSLFGKYDPSQLKLLHETIKNSENNIKINHKY